MYEICFAMNTEYKCWWNDEKKTAVSKEMAKQVLAHRSYDWKMYDLLIDLAIFNTPAQLDKFKVQCSKFKLFLKFWIKVRQTLVITFLVIQVYIFLFYSYSMVFKRNIRSNNSPSINDFRIHRKLSWTFFPSRMLTYLWKAQCPVRIKAIIKVWLFLK